jgi:hypothetical protein
VKRRNVIKRDETQGEKVLPNAWDESIVPGVYVANELVGLHCFETRVLEFDELPCGKENVLN